MNTVPSGELVTEQIEDVLRIEISNPERMNALDLGMFSELAEILRAAGDNPEIGAILLQGRGESFCSGNDVNDFLDRGDDREAYRPVGEFMRALYECPTPVVAAVNGPAVGIGATMLLHCDLVYAAEESFLHMPFVTLGLCPEFASTLLLPRRIGLPRASLALLLGEPIGAERALQWGLVNTVCPLDSLLQEAASAAARLAALPREAVRTTKRLLRSQVAAKVDTAIREESEAFMGLLGTAAFRDAALAFLERSPDDPTVE
ncbi:MAG TPA: enoyl-CoA hydratase-related protein [Gammaproteobacteria bacterium]